MQNPKSPNQTNQPLKAEEDFHDPFFGLKYIAWCRSQLPPSDVPYEDEDLIEYARWQICKKRNKLFNDPIFNSYSPEEMLIEFFAISFDDNEEAREAFKAKLAGRTKPDYDWFEKMEQDYLKKKTEEVKEKMGGKDEISESF